EFFPLVMTCERGDRTVGIQLNDARGGMFAGEQASFAVVGQAVGHIAGVAKHLDPGHFIPTTDDVSRHVRKKEKFLLRVPHWSFGKKKARGNPTELGARGNNALHTIIAYGDVHT